LIRPSNVARALTGLTTSAGSGPSTVSPAQPLSTTVSAASTVAASTVTAAKSRLRLNEVGVQFMAPIHARLRSATSALAWVNWKAAPPQRTPTPRGQVGVGRRGTARVALKRMLLRFARPASWARQQFTVASAVSSVVESADLVIVPRETITADSENPARQRARAKLEAAGILATDFRVPDGVIALSEEDIAKLGQLTPGARPSEELIDEDRGLY